MQPTPERDQYIAAIDPAYESVFSSDGRIWVDIDTLMEKVAMMQPKSHMEFCTIISELTDEVQEAFEKHIPVFTGQR